ncbi:receptor activity-modifying protein 1-like [Cololabis saira]|uniref:receptor activity-modifying protein 1-like n=1 Tax=Cololabis saira TaxID=129043 RepID=UPI002AD458B6|nr:receptor activity-modifying protein 1-like [Cololabis saira]
MIFYLFIPALLLGFVESQLTHFSEEILSKVVNNQTFGKFTNDNTTTRPNNLTTGLFEDELTEIEAVLRENQTYAVIQEDNERSQHQEFPDKQYNHAELIYFSHSVCGKVFHQEMQAISTEDWCVLDNIIRPYNDLTECLKRLADLCYSYFPNADIEDFFLFIHSNYFQNCTNEEEVQFKDAPHSLVIVLTVIPVSIIPVLVYLAVSKS